MKTKKATTPKTQEEIVLSNMQKSQKRCLSVAKRLRADAARLLEEASRQETKAAGFGKVAATLSR